MTRKAIPDPVQNAVLLKCRRRCCLCFWLDGNDDVKKGQLAHLDHDNSNPDEQNIVFLCYDHHEEYDGRTSTSKGLTEGEIRRWRDELHKEMEHRFRTVLPGPLTIFYDEERHCFKEENNQCAVYRIGVRNDGVTTVSNVAAKIAAVRAVEQPQNDELRRLLGLKLSVCVNPFVGHRHPDNPPESTVILHPAEEATFDLVRLCRLPANFHFLHSHFVFNAQCSRWDQFPRGGVPGGHYRITISAHGTNLAPVEKEYDISATTAGGIFHGVDAIH